MVAAIIIVVIIFGALGIWAFLKLYDPLKNLRSEEKAEKEIKEKKELQEKKDYHLEITKDSYINKVNMYTIALIVPVSAINRFGLDDLTDFSKRDVRKMITDLGYKTFDYPTYEFIRVVSAKGEIIDFDFLITQDMQIFNAKEEYFKKLYHDVLEENKSGLIFYYHNCFKADLTDLKK